MSLALIDRWSRHAVWTLVLAIFWCRDAWALQPLSSFLHAALVHNVDVQDAEATVMQQKAQFLAALGQVLPSVELRGTYTRNQYKVGFPISLAPGEKPIQLTIQPQNQYDGFATLSVPLVNLSKAALVRAAQTSENVVLSQREQTRLSVQMQVVQTYYQLIANAALVEASHKALDVARASLCLTEALFSSGRSAALDVDRAKAEVERQNQQSTQAQLQQAIAIRHLESLSLLRPELNERPGLDDDLHQEKPLSAFERADADIPVIRAAIGLRQTRDLQASAQKLTYLPTLSGTINERLTNSTGFSAGRSRFYNVMINLSWSADLSTFGNVDAAVANAASAKAQEQRTRIAARDAIFVGWHTVAANIARSHSAREQQKVSQEAANLAKDRYASGLTTQLELLQAQRDAFAADVSRIQADADLINSRIQLRLSAGLEISDVS